ncbi:MAG: DUF1788 domain-containing protein [Gudongella sp.]|nr:DUF1788 domain-containing protein [Gudongella sp.]
MRNFQDRLDAIEDKIRSADFRENKGLGNEVGYYVFHYPPDKEIRVRNHIEHLKSRNLKGLDGYELVVFDLYDMIIDILEEEGFMEQIFNFEKKKGFDRITKAVGNLLKINDNDSMIVKRIEENTPQDAVVFLTGIGKCYPILRSHKILNNLHQAMDRVPVVLFYPGKFDGQQLILFESLKDNNYYRAFPLID